MRFQSVGIGRALLPALLSTALFAGGEARGLEGPSTRDKAGSGPSSGSSSSSASSAGSTSGAGTTSGALNADTGNSGWGGLLGIKKSGAGNQKPWEVGLAWEGHALIDQQYTGENASTKLLSVFYAYAQADITRNNRVSLRGGFYVKHMADDTESGVRAEDLSLTYTRRVQLPWAIDLRLGAGLTAPISFYSQKAGIITSPRGSVALERRFLKDHLSVDLRAFGGGYIVKYANKEGGGANPRGFLGWLIGVEYEVHHLEALAIGAELVSEYTWYYEVNPDAASNPYGVVADPQFAKQPAQQVYGGEVYLRYAFPKFYGVKTEARLAYASGDPFMGYNSILHDGVGHLYGYFYQTSSVYGLLSAAY